MRIPLSSLLFPSISLLYYRSIPSSIFLNLVELHPTIIPWGRPQLDLPMHFFLRAVDTTLSFVGYFPVPSNFQRILISARLLGSRPERWWKKRNWVGMEHRRGAAHRGYTSPNALEVLRGGSWIFRGLATALTFPNAPRPRVYMHAMNM